MPVKRLQRILSRAELTTAALMMAAMVVLVFWAALSRYVSVPVNWSVDAAQGLFVWIIFLGASQALRRRRHIGVSIATERLSARSRLVIRLLVDVLMIGFLAVIIRYAILVSIVNSARQFPSFALSYSWVTIAVAVGGVLMLITTCVDFIDTLRQVREKE